MSNKKNTMLKTQNMKLDNKNFYIVYFSGSKNIGGGSYVYVDKFINTIFYIKAKNHDNAFEILKNNNKNIEDDYIFLMFENGKPVKVLDGNFYINYEKFDKYVKNKDYIEINTKKNPDIFIKLCQNCGDMININNNDIKNYNIKTFSNKEYLCDKCKAFKTIDQNDTI